ncbi:MAG TPA: DUF5060 domain-containing protein [Bacteroidales bacterium]|nr:DUF5060 domain-containing protein [Bacteroidales bacterium]
MNILKLLSASLLLMIIPGKSETTDNVPLYSVIEIGFEGKRYVVTDNPVRDIVLQTTWINEDSRKTLTVYGFYDGDGSGNPSGNIFRVRFCPTETGKWTLIRVVSNDRKLNGQHEGLQINATASEHHGFWMPDPESPGSRWYKRSDGTHQYITGNTMYSFLSEYFRDKPAGGNIRDDIIKNSIYFKKVRIGITGDRYPHPSSKPFLDFTGNPTDDGNYSHRPNTEWFYNRLDRAVKTGFEKDLITDLILNGPDTKESRSVLKAAGNNNDVTPILRYIAARYGSYPNVWLCLSNEFDIKEPSFTPSQIISFGEILQTFLPYPTPVSVHSVRFWTKALNTPSPSWFDHVILQSKLKKSDQSADHIEINFIIGGENKPVIDDELAYEGKGDGWTEEDVVEAFLGAFAGGGYGSTGHKPANKEGHYFSGNFKPEEHRSADNLLWFREVIDNDIRFWKMEPVPVVSSDNIFMEKFDSRLRILGLKGEEYVLAGSFQARVTAILPEGSWMISSYDLISMQKKVLSEKAEGRFEIDFSSSRAQMFHLKKI